MLSKFLVLILLISFSALCLSVGDTVSIDFSDSTSYTFSGIKLSYTQRYDVVLRSEKCGSCWVVVYTDSLMGKSALRCLKENNLIILDNRFVFPYRTAANFRSRQNQYTTPAKSSLRK